ECLFPGGMSGVDSHEGGSSSCRTARAARRETLRCGGGSGVTFAAEPHTGETGADPMRLRNEHKILFTGSMGAGKTAAIGAVSEIEPVTTDVLNSMRDGVSKATTTVGLDYGEITLDGGEKLRLYGTPGQERFSAMWDILSAGALGVVILIDHSRE